MKTIHSLHSPLNLKDSMLYSVEAGGKRLRPILMMAAYEAFDDLNDRVVEPAVALELVHTYSLIHDDLPAMDDDDYRRGKLTNHKQFNEATAILAGDALLTAAFQVISSSPHIEAEEKVFLTKELSTAAGPEGMVAGQMLDLEAERQSLSLEDMSQIHLLKTGQLIRFAIRAGAYLAGAKPPQLEAINEYAVYLGLIFQIQDDILDVVGNEEKLGKPVGSDEQSEKSTYPKILGLDGARRKKEEYMEKAYQALKTANVREGILYEFVDYLGNRDA
ncbi:polyprenyl synthetase family protein [Salinibacillus xinjiangensis]|uniref:Farnesyl diphosphate synthase n=2 Tax=Salinibacillus xinjiangensis TaxID=1229268 RepID=A0A6G1X6B9_9BACI|nr:polyprenyl synthetase family protein [Salinibacillus xinjiangensis]